VVLQLRAFRGMRQAIETSPTWKEVYRDDLAAVYARR
jgi:hypothetical protein